MQRRGHRVLHFYHVVVAQNVELARGNSGFDMRCNEVEHFGREAPGDSHFFDFFRGLDVDGHLRAALKG